MHRYKRLAVCLSGGEGDRGLIEYAAAVAHLGTASEARFVHVRSGPAEAAADVDIQDKLQPALRDRFAEVTGVNVMVDFVRGPLVDGLLGYAAEHATDLLLVGHRRGGPGRNALARRLAMKAPCSVWMVPDGAPPRFRRILVPVDFSEHAADAMRVATSLAALAGSAECIALHVYFNEAVITYEEFDQVLRGDERRAYQQFIDRVDCHGVTVTPVIEEGADVGNAIARVAQREQADLIVMATRGRSRSAAILLGSVTEEMIVETAVPLLAVKHFGASLGVLQALWELRDRDGGLHTD